MSFIKITEVKEEKDYQPLSISSTASFHQSFFYGRWQEKMGRRVRRFKIERGGHAWGFFQITTYPLVLGKNYCYIPHGPILAGEPDDVFLVEFCRTISQILKEENGVFARFDFYSAPKDGGGVSPLPVKIKHKGYKKTPPYAYQSAAFQSKFNWVVNIDKTPDELLASTHSKTRYRIRYAEKHGVTTEVADGRDMQEYFETFCRLMRETASRARFNLHPLKYYRAIFDDALTNLDINLVLSRYQDEILATYIIVYFGDIAFYPLGASNRLHKELMPTYLTHWRAILEGQKHGCKYYNFGAVNVGDKLHNQMWEGISEFKTRFKGEVLTYNDSYDIVGQKFWYTLYNLRKKLRPPMHKKAMKLEE